MMPSALPIHVFFVLLPHSLALDWAGPAEALRIANQSVQRSGQPARFVLHFVGPQAQAPSSVGVCLAGLQPLPATLPQPSWVVLVGEPSEAQPAEAALRDEVLHWLRGLHLQCDRLELVCVCAGALWAARAGLLAGHAVTTHHHHLEALATADPQCRVQCNRVFVDDAPVYTSAGMTCGIDLALHRIAQTCGSAVAAQVAQTMATPLRRGPQDAELSPFLLYRNHLHAALHRVQDRVGREPQADWTLPRMAEVAHTSARHLTRLFHTHAGIAPLAWLRLLRLALAEAALRSGHSVTQAAAAAGFGSDAQLRRAWRQAGRAGTPSACAAQPRATAARRRPFATPG